MSTAHLEMVIGRERELATVVAFVDRSLTVPERLCRTQRPRGSRRLAIAMTGFSTHVA